MPSINSVSLLVYVGELCQILSGKKFRLSGLARTNLLEDSGSGGWSSLEDRESEEEDEEDEAEMEVKMEVGITSIFIFLLKTGVLVFHISSYAVMTRFTYILIFLD